MLQNVYGLLSLSVILLCCVLLFYIMGMLPNFIIVFLENYILYSCLGKKKKIKKKEHSKNQKTFNIFGHQNSVWYFQEDELF